MAVPPPLRMLMMMDHTGMEAHQVGRAAVELSEARARPRACTWPPCPDGFPGDGGGGGPAGSGKRLKAEPHDAPACRAERAVGGAPLELKHPAGAPAPACLSALDAAGQLRKAKSSRRNAWGNQSYADLITRAIESTPEKRLTLSQIYDWMVRFVPYFKDKGDSNSSAGWKVSSPPAGLTPVGPVNRPYPHTGRGSRSTPAYARGYIWGVTGFAAPRARGVQPFCVCVLCIQCVCGTER